MEVPESQTGIPRYFATDSPSFTGHIFPEQLEFLKKGKLLTASPADQGTLSTQENTHLPLVCSLAGQPTVPFVFGRLH